MENNRADHRLELVGSPKTSLDVETRRACRKIAIWAITKTDLTFGQRERSLDYIAHDLEMELPLFRKGFMVLVNRKYIEPGKSNEKLDHHNIFTVHPEGLISDAEIASKGLIKAISSLGNGNHDPVQTSAA